MARRIRHVDVGQALEEAGHSASEFIDGDWDPGYRTAQSGPRRVHVFHDGPGEADHLTLYTAVLRALDYAVVPEQQDHGGRRRLAVTRP
ncbi:hypothetical protein ACIOHE_15795 [Streptomyces sp. NPDC087851]|uniref:hypothetical protein n=1 Tax=Streptomyces sp. NPDC087851 TaxID=3365810 RepID=UPI003826327D